MLRITVYSAPGRREILEFEDDQTVTFGRSPTCEIVLPENYVSRNHGIFSCTDGVWSVEDNRSKTGFTLIQGARREQIKDREVAQKRALKGGETVQVLNILMRIEVNPTKPAKKEGPVAKVPTEENVAPAAITQMSDIGKIHQQLWKDGQKLSLVLDLTKELSRLQDLDEILKRIGNTVFQAFPSASHFSVCVKREEAGETTFVPRTGLLRDGTVLELEQITISHSIIDLVMKRDMAMLYRHIDGDTTPSTSVLAHSIASSMVVPLSGADGYIGVLEVDNRDSEDAFSKKDLDLLLVLGSSAAFALERSELQANIQAMFDGFVHASVSAIEARDPTTSGHSRRVADMTLGLAEATNRENSGSLGDVNFNDQQLREIHYAGMLHDFGKVSVRERVLVKGLRLYPEQMERLVERFKMIRVSYRAQIASRVIGGGPGVPSLEEAPRWIEGKTTQFDLRVNETLLFLQRINQSGPATEADASRLQQIAGMSYLDEDGSSQPFLQDDELVALMVARGTLTKEERAEIEGHVTHTFRFLKQIPWSAGLNEMADIVHAHHEKLDGTGYPLAIKGIEIPLQSRMLTVCDIFDAVTAMDRPYRTAVPIQVGLDIISQEAERGKIDGRFVRAFIDAKVWRACKKEDEGTGIMPVPCLADDQQSSS